ncbi:MAG: amidohydrolase family protein, partial [Rhizobiales bacterium]|nr:amidohydrolase family protein [Hyphomicrobiales bacterium]
MSAVEEGGQLPHRIELLVRHAYVITVDEAGRIFADGAIAIDRGRIVAVGDDAAIAARYQAARTIDAHGAPAHPGFVECHLHASFQTFRGALPDQLRETDAFDTFESVFFNTVTDEEEYLAVLLASMEMIRNGTTCFLEAGT